MAHKRATAPAMPACVTRYMAEYDESALDVATYIKRQVAFFAKIKNPATTQAGWVALKLGSTINQAERAIMWAKGYKP